MIHSHVQIGTDQYYPGTCEADLVCSESVTDSIVTQSLECPEGFICDQYTNTTVSVNFQCRFGYVCDFATTPDPTVTSPTGQFKKLCPAGFVCSDGTGLGQQNTVICPPNYYCPTGTADHLVGHMAGDAANRGLTTEQANPYLGTDHVVYTVNDDVRMISNHDKRCLGGVDTDLVLRYTVDWHAEGEDLANPFLLYLLNHRPGNTYAGDQVPYSNISIVTGLNSTSIAPDGGIKYDYYRPEAINEAVKENTVCARDHKWRLIDQTIYRKECDCVNFFRVVIAVYRLWLCTFPSLPGTISFICHLFFNLIDIYLYFCLYC